MQADVIDLLRCYREAIELADDPPASRNARFDAVTRVLTWLRPTWGLHRLAVEHVRMRTALVDRHFARRLALGENDSNDEEDRKALSLFTESLPPPRSRLWVALPLLGVAAMSQVLLALLQLGKLDLGAPFQAPVKDLAGAAELTSGQLLKTIDTLLYTSPRITLLAAIVLTLSAYIVWRPLLPSFRLKRIILGMPAAIGRRTERSELGARAQGLGVQAWRARGGAGALRRPRHPAAARERSGPVGQGRARRGLRRACGADARAPGARDRAGRLLPPAGRPAVCLAAARGAQARCTSPSVRTITMALIAFLFR